MGIRKTSKKSNEFALLSYKKHIIKMQRQGKITIDQSMHGVDKQSSKSHYSIELCMEQINSQASLTIVF